jgi:hypothetical protein
MNIVYNVGDKIKIGSEWRIISKVDGNGRILMTEAIFRGNNS